MGLLPEIKSTPTVDPCKLTYLIYGCPKIGKTTFCAGLPDALFLDTEEGTRLQNVYSTPIKNWETFLRVVDEICAVPPKHKFRNIVIDTTEKLAGFCINYGCAKLGIKHPTEAAYGKSYDIIKKDFEIPIVKLQQSGLGVFFICHEEVKKIEAAIGNNYDYHQPKLPGFLSNIILSLCDFILFACNEQVMETNPDGKIKGMIDKRVFHTKPSKEWLAGDRLVNAPLPKDLPMKTSEFLEVLSTSLKKNLEISSNG